MIIKFVAVFHLFCILFQGCVASPDDVDLLSTAPRAKVQERSNMTEQMMSMEAGDGGLLNLQSNESEIDLRAVLCPWFTWDSDVMCMDS